jgi:hypothetical protein
VCRRGQNPPRPAREAISDFRLHQSDVPIMALRWRAQEIPRIVTLASRAVLLITAGSTGAKVLGISAERIERRQDRVVIPVCRRWIHDSLPTMSGGWTAHLRDTPGFRL